MDKYVTQEHFDIAVEGLHREDTSIRGELSTFREEMNARFDEVITILKRLDQERIFMIEWVRRIESDVNRIKGHLKIA